MVGTPFLLQAIARSDWTDDVHTMPEEELYAFLCALRWPMTNGSPFCPGCGSVDLYPNRTRRQWKCKDCGTIFSLTSGTVLHGMKLPLRKLVLAVLTYVNAVKGLSALQLARQINVQHKTAFILLHKLRGALLQGRPKTKMRGVVQIDGAYIMGSVRKVNRISDPKQAQWQEARRERAKQKKRCILVLRQADGLDKPSRTLTTVIKEEAKGNILPFVREWVDRTATIVSDQHPAYAELAGSYKTEVVNHAKNFRGEKPIEHINLAESYFSRFRRCSWGQVHKMSLRHLAAYANEIAYRKDTRRMPNGDIAQDVLSKALCGTKLDEWTCYSFRGRKSSKDRTLRLAA